MNAAAKTQATPATTAFAIFVVAHESPYGTKMPCVDVRLTSSHKRGDWRLLNAKLHEIAAKVEAMTPATESWVVGLDKGDSFGRVFLEMSEGDDEEAARAMTILRKAVQ